jgi:hypothetical protein
MSKFALDALTIESSQSSAESELKLLWRGRSLDRQPARSLAPYLADAVTAAAEAKLALEMHFEKLDYFNSATVIAIVQCLHSAKQRGVRVRIVYDDDQEWQRLSFDPMQVFAVDGMLELKPLHAGAKSS